MTRRYGKRQPGRRRGLPARPPGARTAGARTAAETWIDARLELFSIRCIAVDGGLRWLTETGTGMAARARGLGMGWVSVLEPREISEILEVPAAWALIAYLCIGTPVEEHQVPELDRAGWQKRLDAGQFITRR